MTVRLICGDALEALPTLDGPFDAIITDLPYGTTACKWDTVIPFGPMWAQVKRLLKPRGAFVTTASQPFTSLLVASNLEWFKYEWIWEKDRATCFLDASRKPLKAHENMVVFSRNGHTYNPQKTAGHKPGNRPGKRGKEAEVYRPGLVSPPIGGSTERYPRSVIKFNTPNSAYGTLHPTQKPVALYEYLVRTYTNEGDTVLDFCMGSGTTGVAAINTGRSFVGVELDAGYYAIAQRRIAEAQQQIALPLMEAAS